MAKATEQPIRSTGSKNRAPGRDNRDALDRTLLVLSRLQARTSNDVLETIASRFEDALGEPASASSDNEFVSELTTGRQHSVKDWEGQTSFVGREP